MVTDNVKTSALVVKDVSDEDVGVTTLEPTLIETFGTSMPSGTHNVVTTGKAYSFAGQAAFEDLYTEKYITGKTQYTIYIDNKKSYLDYLTVEIYTTDYGLVDTVSVQGQTQKSFTLKNDSSSSKVYLRFKSPSHFSGYLKIERM